MCRPPGSLAKARLRTARRSVPATFVGCVLHLRLFQEGQNSGSPTVQSVAILVDGIRRWELLVSRLVVQQSEGDLLHVVAALHSACGFPRRLNRRKQQCHHDSSANHEYNAQSTKYRDNDDGGVTAIFPGRVRIGHDSSFPEFTEWGVERIGLAGLRFALPMI